VNDVGGRAVLGGRKTGRPCDLAARIGSIRNEQVHQV
jgi:hypothetical protein